MVSTLDNIWNEVLDLIKVELTEVSFNTWLKTIKPITITDERVILAAPNEFTKGILEARYLNLIKNAITQITNEEYAIKFIIPGEEVNINIGQSIQEETNESNQRSQLNPKYTLIPSS